MLFKTPQVSRQLARQLDELDELRKRLGDQARIAGPWLGSLRRQLRASSAESSIEIEGFHVSESDTLGVASGDVAPDPGDDDRMALSCYARAMDHVGVMARTRSFAGSTGSSSTCTSTPATSRRTRTPACTA